MSSVHESSESKKAMAYDLIRILEEDNANGAKTYSMEDIKAIINNYITAVTSSG